MEQLFNKAPNEDFRLMLIHKVFDSPDFKKLISKLPNWEAQLQVIWDQSRSQRSLFYESNHPLQKFYIFRRQEDMVRKFQDLNAETTKYDLVIDEMRKNVPVEGGVYQPKVTGKYQNLIHLEDQIHDLPAVIPPFKKLSLTNVYPKKNIQDVLSQKDFTKLEKAKSVQEIIEKLVVPKDVIEACKTFAQEKGYPLILRSSAALEDQGETAAAGLFDSIIVKKDSEIESALKKVLSSAFSERTLNFFPEEKWAQLFNMEIFAQKYIEAEDTYSGVAFSVAQSDNWNIAGLQLVGGLGGGVNGRGNPMLAYFDKSKNLLSDFHMTNDRIPSFVNSKTLLTIGHIIKTLEQRYRYPVEIEFAATEKQLYIVQIRPITKP